MITVTNLVQIYEINHQKVSVIPSENIVVSSHWNDRERVNISFGDKSLTVIARDLKTAIDNATNTNRF